MQKVKNVFVLVVVSAFLFFPFASAHSATGCNFPSSLDSYTNKQTGDYLTVADVNSRSCAIEQLELAMNKLIAGTSGGVINVVNTNPNIIAATVTGGSVGPRVALYHDGNTPDIAVVGFSANDSTGVQRQTGYIQSFYLNATSTALTSQMNFCVMNSVNAANCNAVASLDSLGHWTDASSAALKDYEGDISGTLDKLGKLSTLGVYHAKGLPPDKLPQATRHYGPTAEDFHQVFGLGGSTGISPSDVAWLSVKAVVELEQRVKILEGKVK